MASSMTDVASLVFSVLESAARQDALAPPQQPVRIDDCLWCVNARPQEQSLLPLFAAPSITGTGDTFASLASSMARALYYLEHPALSIQPCTQLHGSQPLAEGPRPLAETPTLACDEPMLRRAQPHPTESPTPSYGEPNPCM